MAQVLDQLLQWSECWWFDSQPVWSTYQSMLEQDSEPKTAVQALHTSSSLLLGDGLNVEVHYTLYKSQIFFLKLCVCVCVYVHASCVRTCVRFSLFHHIFLTQPSCNASRRDMWTNSSTYWLTSYTAVSVEGNQISLIYVTDRGGVAPDSSDTCAGWTIPWPMSCLYYICY